MFAVILIILGWVACGLLAQGMCQYNLARKKSKPEKRLSLLLFSIGPFSLIVAIIISYEDQTWGLKFRK